MSAEHESETSGRPKGLSASVEASKGVPIDLIRHLLQRAVEKDGEIAPAAEVVMALRRTGERPGVLADAMAACCPPEVDAGVWLKWLSGGRSPFEDKIAKPTIRKPTIASERPANALLRTSSRVAAQQQAVADAEARLQQEREHLRQLQAHDAAMLHFVVQTDLANHAADVLALGPLYTIARAVSSFQSEQDIERELLAAPPSEREGVRVWLVEQRRKDTEFMLEALDFFCGYGPAEKAIRVALLHALKELEPLREEAAQDGRKRRSAAARSESVRVEARPDSEEVVAGLQVAADQH